MEASAHLGHWGTPEMGVFICSGWAACGEEETRRWACFALRNTGFIYRGGSESRAPTSKDFS